MRFLAMGLVLFSILSCGKDKKESAAPTGCTLVQVEEGVQWSCVDSDGKATSGVVKHGARGSQGEPGAKGEKGEGLVVSQTIKCSGSIEGWLEKSAYQIDVKITEFETKDKFMAAVTKLVRDGQVINERYASSFYMYGMGAEWVSDGQFKMTHIEGKLEVTSQGGIKATLPCEVVL